jgi:predicted MFS family arabinose efflux permease
VKENERENRRERRKGQEKIRKRKGGRRFGWLLAALAVVALACLIFAWLHRGELILSPTYLIESTSEMTFGENGQTVVIDNGKLSVLVLDAEGKLIRRYDGGSDEAPFYYAAYAVQAQDGSIYVADLKYGDRGLLIDWERIIRLDGDESRVVYMIDYSLWAEEDTPMQYGRILELQAYEDSVYFLVDMGSRIDLKQIGSDGTVRDMGSVPAEGVKTDASYDVKTGQVVVISRNGQVTVYRLEDGSARPAELDREWMPFDIAARSGQVYYTEIQDLVVRHFPIDDPASDRMFTSLDDILFKLDVSQDGQSLLATNQAGFYRLSVGPDGECASEDYVDSALIADFYRSIITWIILAVGALLSLFLILRFLRFLIPRIAENETAMRAILIVLASLAVAFIVSTSLLNNLLTNSTDASKTQLDLFTQLLLSRMDVDTLKKIDGQENFNDENFNALHEQLSGPVKQSYANGQYYYFVIYRERNGFLRAVTDSEKSSPCWTPVYENEGNEYADVLHTGESVAVSEISAYGAWAFQLTPIRDKDGSIIGLLEVGQSLAAVEERQNELKREVIVSTAIGTIVVAMLLIELAFLVGFIQKRKKAIHPDTTDLVPVRSIMFLSYLADAMQDAFIAIVCSQLYEGGLPVPDGVAIALPMSLQLLMMALFSLLAGRLTEKMGSRRSISLGMAVQFAGFLICLLMGNYWGLLLGKMLIGSGMGIIYVGCNTVSATGGTEEKVSAAFAGVSAGTLSGVTIGAGLSSVLLAMGGWHLIYLAGCIIVGIGFLLAVTSGNVMPLKSAAEVPETGRVRLRDFLFSRRVLSFFVLMLLPFMMSLSYREYFFPLFAQEHGIDEVRIGQIYLLCGIMVIYVGPALSSFLLRKLGAKKSVVLASAVVGLDMLIFIIHPSLISVIIGVVIISAVTSFAYTCQYTYVEQLPESTAYSEGRAMGVYSVFESLGQTVGPVAYGSLLTFGYQKGIGIFCGAMFALIVLFLLLQWNKKKVKN